MHPLPDETPAVAPLLTAGLLLSALPSLTSLGLPHPTAAEILEKTGASKTRAYELRSELLGLLPSLLRPPGRPVNPSPPPIDTSQISLEVIAFLMKHPGSASTTATRHHYSDGFRHRVLELAEQHPMPLAPFSEAVGVPMATVQDWLATPKADPSPSVEQKEEEGTHACIGAIVGAWRTWDGGFSAFCQFVRGELSIAYGDTLIRRILQVHAGRGSPTRPGRSPDEKAMRKALVTFFPGAQWFEDGSPISITLNHQKYTFNWELVVDGASGALVGMSLRPEEDGRGVEEAFVDGVVTTGAPPLAINSDNRASNHTEEVKETLGETLDIRTTLGRPQTDAPVEGAFGLFQQTSPPLQVSGATAPDLAQAILSLILTVWCRATNHRPRKDRKGRSRVELYAGETPTPEQISAAKAQLEERRRRQELAFQTRRSRLNPKVQALLDEAFTRLGFDDPKSKSAIGRYPHQAVLAGIATFEGKRDAGTLPAEVGARYLLGIVRKISERDEGLAIAEHLWRLRLNAQNQEMKTLEAIREATVGSPLEQVRICIDHALSSESLLVRGYWLTAAGNLVRSEPPDQHPFLYRAACRRIHGTFRVDPQDRQAAVRALAIRVLPV